MAITQMERSEQSPSKFKSKLKPKTTWADAKRNLVKKRLVSLAQKENINNEVLEDVDRTLMCFKDETSETHDPHAYVGVLTLTLDKVQEEEPQDHKDRPLVCFEGKTTETVDPIKCVGISTSAVDRAQEVQANLSPQFPSLLKPMLKSHVSGGFTLSLPKKFCDVHLPKHDETIILVDENGKEYVTKYLLHKIGLSGGWRGFSIAHGLVEGDVLVFQLIEPLKFKVYIVRENRLTDLDGAIGLLNLDVHAKQVDADFLKIKDEPEVILQQITEAEHQKYSDPSSSNSHKDKNFVIYLSDYDQPNFAIPISDDDEPTGDQSDSFGSVIEERIRLSESVLDFKDVKCFKNFSIHVDGLILDSEIPSHQRAKYYELCCSQNMFLHDSLIQGLNIDLSVGIISETVNIADGIRAVKSTTSLNHLESWDRTLKAFEDLGMMVGFLRARIQKLLNLSRESEAVIEAKTKERVEAEEMMRDLEERLLKIKGLMKGLDCEIEGLKVKNEGLGLALKEIASASW